MTPIRLALAQINPAVGALEENRAQIETRLDESRRLGVTVVLFPELVLSGYPPEDLLLNEDFVTATRTQLERLLPATRGLLAVVGLPLVHDGQLRNAAALLVDGRWVDTYAKGTLPNYGVFDEKRYFRPGLRCPVYAWDGPSFGINICEDLWAPHGVPERQARAGARWLWNLSSSPYHAEKGIEREALLCRRARAHGVAIAYCNLVGGQDELVFDGESLFVDASGTVRARGPQFREALVVVDVEEAWLGSGHGPVSARPASQESPAASPVDPALLPASSGGSPVDAALRPASPHASPIDTALPPASSRDVDPLDGEPQAEWIEELEGRFFVERVELGMVPGTASPAPALDPSPARAFDPSLAAALDPTPAPAFDPSPAPTSLPPPAAPRDRLPIPGSNRGITERLGPEAEIYEALVLGLGDYCAKNRFRSVVLGLSGGIDSALTAAIAADALGPQRVTGVSLPTRFNSATSRAGAREVAENLGICFREVPIETLHRLYLETLKPVLGDATGGVTGENIQARIRGTLLMALSNAEGSLLLATGNKSELAVGYCTLYGDMAGGFAVIQDVPKTLVYRLARFRNARSPAIPEDTLTRPPSAELRENQVDQDTLPPYDILDEIVQARMEREESPATLVARGLEKRWVELVYRWIDGNEYKRRQAPPGVKITPRSFGRDRRYPVSNGWRWGG
jgi:NAD+ synthetase